MQCIGQRKASGLAVFCNYERIDVRKLKDFIKDNIFQLWLVHRGGSMSMKYGAALNMISCRTIAKL